MCGIAGISGSSASRADARCAIERLRHRGPDGDGTFTDEAGGIALVHTRLAIQDPRPEANQPFADPTGTTTIVYNGELYNVRELRDELKALGHAFRTQSDTEVLLLAYREWGAQCLVKLNGIFAFAIWDARSRDLLVARDGLGVKPLYYSEEGGSFAFASEIKALLCFPGISRSLDPDALASYLRFLWCPAPGTPFKSVRKLEPGEAFVVRDGRIARRWRFYELPVSAPDEQRSVDGWVSAIRDGLSEAVRRQMISDVPLGAFLSGGLDSSAVVALARRHASGRLQCFTIDYDERQARAEGMVRDLPYAERVARHLDVDLHVVRVGAEMADHLQAMVWHLDEPQPDLAALNVLFISRLARSHGIKVLLSGAGGDDVFSGYRRHLALQLDPYWARVPAPVRRLLARGAGLLPSRPVSMRRLSMALSRAGLSPAQRLLSWFDWTNGDSVRGLFAEHLRDGMSRGNPLEEAVQTMPASASGLQRMLLLEQKYFLADHNLNYTDKMSMAAGVEVRVPFLDPDLMQLASRVPDRYRIRSGEAKWILKRAMEPLLPRDVIYRPKTGFGVPLRAWMRGPLRGLVRDTLDPGAVRRRGIFDAGAVTRLVEADERGQGDFAYTILGMVCTEVWCRKFVDSPAGG
jgi:asparagine synthase (glutamine-hydrolysing)